MKPIYFPFTCIPLPVLDRLTFFAGRWSSMGRPVAIFPMKYRP